MRALEEEIIGSVRGGLWAITSNLDYPPEELDKMFESWKKMGYSELRKESEKFPGEWETKLNKTGERIDTLYREVKRLNEKKDRYNAFFVIAQILGLFIGYIAKPNG